MRHYDIVTLYNLFFQHLLAPIGLVCVLLGLLAAGYDSPDAAGGPNRRLGRVALAGALSLVGVAIYRKGPFLPSSSAGGGMALAPCRCLAPVREGSWSTLPTESWWGVPRSLAPVGNSTSGPWDSVRAARRLHNSPGLRPRTNPSNRRRAG